MSFLQHNAADVVDAQPQRGRQISNQNQSGGGAMKEIFAWDANAEKDNTGRRVPASQQRPVTLKPQEQQPVAAAIGSGRRGAGASNRTTYNFMTGE
eukprot:CAMPEP_0176433848 /NCGR_PEP_ID=MMETSP0127-20121128/16296_1 /TAXON_ID=938130 /ORGANISM="Platyophrya macrostoma, Strain WH" /LENGTH=95 /DNA_ID=CAMNT_0017816413 /DNA_START=43 /DNA_END=330 /DNA_ORIENTATION=-